MIKHNELVLIQSQDELNKLEAIEGLPLDSLHIDSEYVAYMDEVLRIAPLKDIDEAHDMRGIKPTLFRKWYKKQKRMIKK